MNSEETTSESRTSRGKRPASSSSPTNSAAATPTTFFLKSDKDMERDITRGRQQSRTVGAGSHITTTSEVEDGSASVESGALADSEFGVQSLQDTLTYTFGEGSRRDSDMDEQNTDAGADAMTASQNATILRKKRAGNPVHPKILATGQRIISSDHVHTQQQTAGSPVSIRSGSPVRSHLRRNSISSINLTPLRMSSPYIGSEMTSTPRTTSPKSLRLSDEDETSSQTFQSSNGEDEDENTTVEGSSMPQLVMPSIALPIRRPFTERGKRMGRLRAMVVGPTGVGKTSLIQSIFRSCEDITHVDSMAGTSQSQILANMTDGDGVCCFAENTASTRPYPSWWTDFESRRMLLRRKSIGDGILERNLCLFDAPGTSEDGNIKKIERLTDFLMRRTSNTASMNDNELINMLSGDGGTQLDVVLWVFDPVTIFNAETTDQILDESQRNLLLFFAKCANIVPLIGRADTIETTTNNLLKDRLNEMFKLYNVETLSFADPNPRRDSNTSTDSSPREPFTVSSALSDDADTIDASILMSSQYLQPLIPSELTHFVDRFFEPDNISRMRHLAAAKYLIWRQSNLGVHMHLRSRPGGVDCGSPLTTTDSLLDEQNNNQVMVPRATSSFFQSNRSFSPSGTSDISALSAPGTNMGQSAYALQPYNDTSEPYREVRLAKWAQDLQRGLSSERKRYRDMYAHPIHSPLAEDNEKALIRPARGRLGGEIAVIDPRDPLGVLALSQTVGKRGWFALRVAGGCGLVAAVAWWVLGNWAEVQSWFGGQESGVVLQAQAVPPPARVGGEYGRGWKEFFGWA